MRPHTRILCWFPRYSEKFNNSLDCIHSENCLSLEIKYYLGIMAVSCFNCNYLIEILQERFVLEGGNLDWITHGLKAVDPQVAKFAEINEILAFQPWKLLPKHCEVLFSKDADGRRWSQRQVLTAIVILSHYHALACFCLGQGLTSSASETISSQNLFNSTSVPSGDNDEPSSDADGQTFSWLKQ